MYFIFQTPIFQLQYDENEFNINISYQLFEKSRLCVRDDNFGSNFHVFYMLLQAPPALKEKLYLNSNKFAVGFDFQCVIILICFISYFFSQIFKILPQKTGKSPNSFNQCNSFNALESMLIESGSIIPEKREAIYSIIAAMLHLGNINFEDNSSSVAEVNGEDGSQQSLERAADLLRMNSKQLQTVLLERQIMKDTQDDRTMYVRQSTSKHLIYLFLNNVQCTV